MALTSTFTSINLPVNNVEQSRAFFTGLGFELNPQFPDNEISAAIVDLDGHLWAINCMNTDAAQG